MLQGLKIWRGELYVGPKIWGASSKGGAKIWGGGVRSPCLPPSDMPDTYVSHVFLRHNYMENQL